MKYDVLYNFISPKTGKILIPEDYILVGDDQGFSIESPILIDMRLDLVNLRRDVNDIFSTPFILSTADDYSNAQSLGNLSTGLLKNTVSFSTGTLSTATPGKDYVDVDESVDDMQIALIRPELIQDGQDVAKLLSRAERLPVGNMPEEILNATFVLKTANEALPEAQVLSELGEGITKLIEDGVFAIAQSGIDYPSVEQVDEMQAQLEEVQGVAAAAEAGVASLWVQLAPFNPLTVFPLNIGTVVTGLGISVAAIEGEIVTLFATKVDKAGDTMTGPLILSGDPVTSLGAATKQYIDNNFLKISNNLSDLGNVSIARTNLGLTNIATQTVTNHAALIGGASNSITSITLTNGQLLIGNTGNDPVAAVPSNGTNISWTTGAGSLTANLTGQVALTNGGTNASLTASNGGIVYSTASALAILSGTATAGQILRSGTSSVPSWSTATYPSTTIINQLLYSSSANVIAGLATANNGVLVTSSGGIPSISSTLPSSVQTNITSLGTIGTGTWNGTIIGVAYGGTGNNTLTANSLLVGNGTSAIAQIAVGATGTILIGNTGSTPSFSGTPTGLTSIGVGNLSLSGNTLSSTNTNGAIILSPNGTGEIQANKNINIQSQGILKLYNSANTFFVGFKAANPASNVTWILPAADSSGFFKSDGAGNMSIGSAVTSVATGTGLSGGTITSTGTISLANTAVTAGSYNFASLTVDAQGRLTAASTGVPVTSVAITGSTGLTVGGSPITSTGTITLTLGSELQGLSGLSSTGLVTRTAANTYTARSIAVGSSNLTISNGSGVSGNPTLGLSSTLTGMSSIDFGNMTIGGTIISTGTNFNLALSPGGNGEVLINSALQMRSANTLKFLDSVNNFYSGLKAGTLTANTTWTLPTADSSGFMKSDGAGNLSFGAAITSVGITGSTGLTVSGSPLTGSGGTITLTLGSELQGFSGLILTGLVARTGTSTYTSRTIGVTNSNLTVSNGNGVSGNPTLGLSTTLSSLTSIEVGNLSISGNTITATSGNIDLTPAANVRINNDLIVRSQNTLRFNNSANTFFVGFKAANPASNVTWILPAADSSGFFKSDGAGNMSIGSAVTSVATGTGLSGGTITSTGTISLANTAVTAGSYNFASLTVDAQGRLTAASTGVPVTSVAITGSTGLTVGGSPITSTGTITLTLGTQLQGLSAISANGLIARTASGTYASRTITGTSGRITITNGNGVSGNPTIDLITTAISAGSYDFPSITFDAYGRATAANSRIPTPTYNQQISSLSEGYNQGGLGGSSVGTNIGISSNSINIFDTTAVNANSKGFNGAVFDGRYIYFVPYNNDTGRSGQITRYDTTGSFTSAGSYSVYDTTAVNANSKGFNGGVFDGRYIYLIPYDYGINLSGQITCYDTTGSFTSAGSYSVYDTTAVNANSKGFSGAVFDGRYIYFVPYDNDTGRSGQITRYDTTGSFTSAGSYSVYDTTAVNANSKGFSGAVFDGRYIYFVPYSTAAGVYSGQITRYDTTGSFTNSGSYSVFDLKTNIDSSYGVGFYGGVFDGRYVYFVPNRDSTGNVSDFIVRYDTTKPFTASFSYISYHEYSVSGSNPAFIGAVFDGKYIWFVPDEYSGKSGQILKYNTIRSLTDTSSYEYFDTTAVNANSKGFYGGVFDGRYVYLIPYSTAAGVYSGQITRIKAYSGPQVANSSNLATLDDTQTLKNKTIAGQIGLASALNTGTYNSLDVSNITVFRSVTSTGNITINGFTNGIDSQVIYIYKFNSSGTLTINHNNASGTQKILNSSASNLVFGSGVYGGVTCVYNSSSNVWFTF